MQLMVAELMPEVMPELQQLMQVAPQVAPHRGPLGLEGCPKFKELLAAGAPRHPIGRFRPRRPGGRGTFSNFELRAPEVAF